LSLSVAIEVRTLNDQGVASGNWSLLGIKTYTAKTTTPQRYSELFTVAAGRYEVRVRRLDAKQTDTRFGHEILWGGLRAYLPETRNTVSMEEAVQQQRAETAEAAQEEATSGL
jgi:hypothetical protein